MKTRKIIAILLMVIFVFSLSVFTNADTPTYQWIGTQENGHTYNGVGVAKFEMSGGHIAFCVDINVTIKKNQDYIRIGLEEAEALGVLTHPERVRAILNYSWNKSGKDELTAIQYALWHYMNGHSLPAAANQNVKDIYNKLLNTTLTPSIPASQESETNVLTVIGPPDSTIEIPNFFFNVSTSMNTDISIKVLKNGVALSAANYDIIDRGGGVFEFIWLEEFTSGVELTIQVTSLNNKSVGAWVFFAIDKNGEIDKSLSQTVAGIKPSETFQMKEFSVMSYIQTTTTEPETTTTTTTEEPTTTTTTVPETTTSVSTTEPETTTVTTQTESTEPPPTTTAPVTTSEPSTSLIYDEEEFPVTGESNVMPLIAIGMFIIGGGLFLIVQRKRIKK